MTNELIETGSVKTQWLRTKWNSTCCEGKLYVDLFKLISTVVNNYRG